MFFLKEKDIERDVVQEYIKKEMETGIEKDTDTHASLYQESLAMHRRLGGVLEVTSKLRLVRSMT